MTEDVNMATLRGWLGPDGIQDLVNRIRPNSFSLFCETLYRDIDIAIRELSRGKNIYSNSCAGEDLYTVVLVSLLNSKGYNATHESNSGGNVDLTIECKSGEYCWLGEAKIFHSSRDAEAGYRQLVTRYSSGYYDQNKAGLLLYDVGRPNNKDAMELWFEHLSKMEITNAGEISCSWCPKGRPQVLYSNHVHPTSGIDYEVRHMAVLLKHDPQDKAREYRRKRATTKSV